MLVVYTEDGSPFAGHQGADTPAALHRQQMNLGDESFEHAL